MNILTICFLMPFLVCNLSVLPSVLSFNCFALCFQEYFFMLSILNINKKTTCLYTLTTCGTDITGIVTIQTWMSQGSKLTYESKLLIIVFLVYQSWDDLLNNITPELPQSAQFCSAGKNLFAQKSLQTFGILNRHR